MSIIFSATLTSVTAGWQGWSLRQVINLPNLTSPGFSNGLIRVTFTTASTTNAGNLDAAYVGAGVSSPVYDFDGSQAQLLFSQSPSFTGITGSATITSDFVPFTFNFSTSVSLVLSMHFSGTTVDLPQSLSSSGDSYFFSHQVVGSEGQSAPGGSWSPSGASHLATIVLIEFVPAPPAQQVGNDGLSSQSVIPGQTLPGNVGLWVNFPTGYAYQLLRNGNVFQAGPWGAGPSYTVQLSDVGSIITLNVIASNSSGSGPVAGSGDYLAVPGKPLITSQTLGTLRNNFGDALGCGFTVGSSAVVVSALGRWVVSGNSGSHLLFIADFSGTTIGTATINTSGLPVGYNYVNIDQGLITLQADSFYYLQSVEVSGGDFWYNVDTTPTVDSRFAYSGAFDRVGGTLTFSDTSGIYGPVNLLFYPVTPAPLGTPILYKWDFNP